jgi:hypothetical protein
LPPPNVSPAVSIRFYKTLMKLAVVYESETWATPEIHMKRLGSTWERKVLRKIHGPEVEQGMWRIRTFQKLGEIHKDIDVVADIKNEEIGMDWACSKNGTGKEI